MSSSATVPWLTPTEMKAWRAFIGVHVDLVGALERDLNDHHSSLGDYQVLVHLSEADGRSMRMCDLANVLQLSPSGLTRRLDRLVADGYVAREGSPDDRRVMMASLTDKGFSHLGKTAPHHVRSVRRHLFDHLDETQIEAMASIFTAIADGLNASGDIAPGAA